jgi:hypothetical protein
VANYGDETIEEFNASSGVGTVFASSGLDGPTGMAFDSAGNLYVGSGSSSEYGGNSAIEEFKSTGGVLSSNGAVFASSGLDGPFSLAFDSAGNLYVGNYFGNNIEKFNSSGIGTVFASGVNLPSALAFDSAGNLYAANNYYNTIQKFDSSGNGTAFCSTVYGCFGMAFDSSGNLYAASEYDSAIYEFGTNGVGTTFAGYGSGVSAPLALTIQPVPEPATWTLVVLGTVTLLGNRCLRLRVESR